MLHQQNQAWLKFREDDLVFGQLKLTWQPQRTSLQQFLRRATILKTFRGRRGFSAGRCRSHRVYNTLIPTLYQRLLRLRRLLHGASSPQLPPALTDTLVPQVQIWKGQKKTLRMRCSGFSAPLILAWKRREYRFQKKKKKRKGRKNTSFRFPGRQALTTGNTYLFPARGGTTSFYLRTDNEPGTVEKAASRRGWV